MQNNSYVIHRIVNNNVITSRDKNDKEILLMGKGIAYLRRVGDLVSTDDIEKVFILKELEVTRYLDIIESIPAQYFDIALEILEYAEHKLHVTSSSIAYVMLADHIASSIERFQQGILVKNEMLQEIKNFYPDAYEIGKAALVRIKDETEVELPIDEAGFIAFHIINLSNGLNHDERSDLIKKIIEVVEGYFKFHIDKESIYYERFITHLKYFSTRIFANTKELPDKQSDDFLYRMLRIQYQDIAKCVDMIQTYVDHDYHIQITNEEKGYLMIHINTLLMKSKMVTE